jgi:hypothetical protein
MRFTVSKRLPRATMELIDKAQDSALQAISTYNNPRSSFRTGNFTVLMVIAWTALVHAYFESKRIKYFYKKENGRYEYRDGDKMAWDLSKCIKEIFKENDPIRINIELFIKLRNKIEHRNLPALDQETQGECQAMALNFESWLSTQFGKDISIIDTMFVPIQLTTSKRNLPKSKAEQNVINFVKNYRSLLSADVENSQQYQFKAFLLPKIGNHRTSSDMAIEWLRYDENDPEEMEKYKRAIVAIKDKLIPVANIDRHLPSVILNKIEEIAGKKQTLNWHVRMWKKYKVRPTSDATNKTITKSEFCVYDTAHKDYQYTNEWVDFLIREELS